MADYQRDPVATDRRAGTGSGLKTRVKQALASTTNPRWVAEFQTIYRRSTLDQVGVEALARWRHPTLGLIPFGQLTSESTLLPHGEPIMGHILSQTATDMAAANIDHLDRLQINIDPADLRNLKSAQALVTAAQHADPGIDRIVVELRADHLATCCPKALSYLASSDVDLSLDHFPCHGDPNIDLSIARPTQIKIAPISLTLAAYSALARHNLQTAIDRARQTVDEIVAVGIETEQHQSIADKIDVDLIQGFAYSRPGSLQQWHFSQQQTLTPQFRSAPTTLKITNDKPGRAIGQQQSTWIHRKHPVNVHKDRISIGPTTIHFRTNQLDDILAAYIELIDTVRHEKATSTILLRQHDLTALANALKLPTDTLLARLASLLVGDTR